MVTVLRTKKLLPWLMIGAIALFFLLAPRPEGLTSEGWILSCIFLCTITAFISAPLPMPIIGLISLTICPLSGIMTTQEALSAFSNPAIWLIVTSFALSRAFIKAGLGRRIAYLFMRWMGKSTLGLAYSLMLTGLLLAPIIPSGAARLGSILDPLHLSIAHAYDSRPENGTARRIGSYLFFNILQCNFVSNSLFLTSMSTNLMIAGFAYEFGIKISWGTWFLGALLPGGLTLVAIPLVLYLVWPPEIKRSPEIVQLAREELEKMGPMSRHETVVLTVFTGLLILWIGGDYFGISTTTTAMLGLAMLLVLGEISWDDVCQEKGAWSTMIWFSAVLMMAKFLISFSVISWAVGEVFSLVENLPWRTALVCTIILYFYSHYCFASQLAHAAAMFSGVLALLLEVGVPPLFAALTLCYCNNLMGGLTYYGSGSGPLYMDSGYIPVKDWFFFGFIISLINLFFILVIGPLWWEALGIV